MPEEPDFPGVLRPGPTARDDPGVQAGRYPRLLPARPAPPRHLAAGEGGSALPFLRGVVGHSRASVTLDVYSHALLDEAREVLAERRDLVMEREEAQSP